MRTTMFLGQDTREIQALGRQLAPWRWDLSRIRPQGHSSAHCGGLRNARYGVADFGLCVEAEHGGSIWETALGLMASAQGLGPLGLGFLGLGAYALGPSGLGP